MAGREGGREKGGLAEIGSGGCWALGRGAAVASQHVGVVSGDGEAVHHLVVGAVLVLKQQVVGIGGCQLGVSKRTVLEDGPRRIDDAKSIQAPSGHSRHNVDGSVKVP